MRIRRLAGKGQSVLQVGAAHCCALLCCSVFVRCVFGGTWSGVVWATVVARIFWGEVRAEERKKTKREICQIRIDFTGQNML